MYNENNDDYIAPVPYLLSGLVYVHVCIVVEQV